MDLAGDGPAPRPIEVPEPVAAQHIHVTPENVVALAAMFRDCADILQQGARHQAEVTKLAPWMGDPVSEWVMSEFRSYFFDGERSFFTILQDEAEQHAAVRDALVATAQLYGLTEELNEAGFVDLTPR